MTAGAPRSAAAGGGEIGVGIGLMTLAMSVLPAMDTLAKLLAQSMAPLQVTLARFVVQALLALIAAAALGRLAELHPPRLGLHLARGLCLAVSTLLFFTAIAVMPIPDTLAIFFVEPMILTALSTVVLGEKVGWRRWSAVLLGFVGALVIIRPSFAVFGLYAVLPLGTALFFALYLLLTRRLSLHGTMLAAQFVTGLAGAGALGLALLATSSLGVGGAGASLPQGVEWPMLFGIGAISFVAHGLVVMAFQRAPANVLAPFNYLEIVSATVLAWLVFGSFPHATTWLGIGLIVGSGIYIAHRERVRRRVGS